NGNILFSSMRRHTRFSRDWSSDVCSSDLGFFSLVRGALRTISGAIGKRQPDDYRMSTPTASIGIRGTEFVVEETVCDPSCHPGQTGRASCREAGSETEAAIGWQKVKYGIS